MKLQFVYFRRAMYCTLCCKWFWYIFVWSWFGRSPINQPINRLINFNICHPLGSYTDQTFFSFLMQSARKWYGFLWLRLPVLLFGSKNCIIFLAYSWMHLEFYISHEFECYFFKSLKTSALSYSWLLSISEIIVL